MIRSGDHALVEAIIRSLPTRRRREEFTRDLDARCRCALTRLGGVGIPASTAIEATTEMGRQWFGFPSPVDPARVEASIRWAIANGAAAGAVLPPPAQVRPLSASEGAWLANTSSGDLSRFRGDWPQRSSHAPTCDQLRRERGI